MGTVYPWKVKEFTLALSQRIQCHDVAELPRRRYSLWDMSRQRRWYHMLQSSQQTHPPPSPLSRVHLSANKAQGKTPSPIAGPGLGCTSPHMIRAINKSLCSATCVMHRCFKWRRRVSQDNSAPRQRLSTGATGKKSEDGHPLGQGSDKKLESRRARNTTTNNEGMTAAWGEKFWLKNRKILPSGTLVGR